MNDKGKTGRRLNLYEKGYRRAWRAKFAQPAVRRLSDNLARLARYCQPPDPNAKSATDIDEALKQFTVWPQEELLKRIKYSVLTLASTERKYPERRIWEMFELVDRRERTLRVIQCINDLVARAKERFTEANFSDLEALSWKRRDKQDVADLLPDIDRIKEDASVGRTIDWVRYKGVLTPLSDDWEWFQRDSGNATTLACYARVLKLIVDHCKWEKLRKESEALVYWLLEIGYPGVSDKEGLEQFNDDASFRWSLEESVRVIRERAAKLAKSQQSGKAIKKTRDDIEDDRLMELVRWGGAEAFAQLRNRRMKLVRGFLEKMRLNSSAIDDIVQKVFTQVWKSASGYVPTPTAKFTSWLIEIAKNTAINDQKRAKKEKEQIEFAHVSETGSAARRKTSIGSSEELIVGASNEWDDDESASDAATERGQDHLHQLDKALNQLSPLERRVVRALLGFDGEKKTCQEIADLEGIAAEEVADIGENAMRRLRQAMA